MGKVRHLGGINILAIFMHDAAMVEERGYKLDGINVPLKRFSSVILWEMEIRS